MTDKNPRERADPSSKEQELKAGDAGKPVSPVLARLIEEVRNENSEMTRAYDRVHHRHNR
jgi:hypothetical protein